MSLEKIEASDGAAQSNFLTRDDPPTTPAEEDRRYIRMIQERLQAICDKAGCEPGLNRLDFLERYMDEHSSAPGQFARMAEHLNAPLPWRPSPDGTELIDAKGLKVVRIDLLVGVRDHREARALASLVLLAVNTCGGFKAVAR